MAKLTRKLAATSQIFQIFIQDSSRTDTIVGLTGLTYSSSGLTAYYHKENQTAGATSISLVDMTIGTFTSGGFKEIDATNMPGWYEFCPPNACFTSCNSVGIQLKGATNMMLVNIEVDLDARVASIFESLTELAAVPSSSPTVAEALMLLYQSLRNDSQATATQRTVRNDAGTVIGTATMSDKIGRAHV